MSEYILRNEVYQKLHEAGGCDASDERDGYAPIVMEILRKNIICADFLVLAPKLQAADTWEEATNDQPKN